MRRAAPPKPHNRDGIWYLVRKVPKDFAALDPRGLVRVSTEIRVADDPRAVRAGAVVKTLDIELHAYWRGLRDGVKVEAQRRFNEAQKRARSLNLDYRTNLELSTGPLDDILKRLEGLIARGSIEDEAEVAAVMGGEDRPALKLSGLYKEYEALMELSLLKHSPRQRKKWGQKYQRAIGVLLAIETVGDKELTSLTRADGVALRRRWQERVLGEGLDIHTANKSMGHILTMLRQVELVHQSGINVAAFEGLRIAGEEKKQRPAYDAKFVQDHILAEGALDGMNPQARAITWIVAEAGMRPVEVANLTRETIFLDAPVPFVRVIGVDRQLKTKVSERDIPMVGAALAAIRHFPNGFDRYHDNEGSLSAAVNSFFSDHKLRPTEGHTLYSLRHCFEDRLTAVEAPEKVIASLMGHAWQREKYGVGPSLAQKRKWLLKIAFTPPEHFGPLA